MKNRQNRPPSIIVEPPVFKKPTKTSNEKIAEEFEGPIELNQIECIPFYQRRMGSIEADMLSPLPSPTLQKSRKGFKFFWSPYFRSDKSKKEKKIKKKEKSDSTFYKCCCLLTKPLWCLLSIILYPYTILSSTFFFPFNRFFNKGVSKPIHRHEMFPLNPAISCQVYKQKIENYIKNRKQDKGSRPKNIEMIIYPLIKINLLFAIVLKAIESLMILIISQLPKYFIIEIRSSATFDTLLMVGIYPVLAFCLNFARQVIHEHSAKYVNLSGSCSGQALRTVIWMKLERTSLPFLNKADGSLITKLMMFNFQEVLNFVSKIPDIFSFPIIMAFTLFFVLLNIGMIGFSLVLVFVATSLVLYIISILTVRQEVYTEYYTSQRTLIVLEILGHLKDIKQDSFEEYFRRKAKDMRTQEENCHVMQETYRTVSDFVIELSVVISILLILFLQNFLDQDINANDTFIVVSIVNSLKNPLQRFRDMLISNYQYKIARDTINFFLYTIPDQPHSHTLDSSLKSGTLLFEDVSASIPTKESITKAFETIYDGGNVWSTAKKYKQDEQEVCSEVTLSFHKGSKTVLLGDEGPDFDNFIYTLLGETTLTKGKITYRGKVLFADAQDPSFVTGDTLKNNIIMGEDFIESRYLKILEVVDLHVGKFVGRDQVEVLQGGLNFSSSEKQKIILARMLYVAGDVYIIKDFFNHDAPAIEQFRYRRVVNGFLSHKTVIIVTKSIHICQLVNNMVVFRHGKALQFPHLQAIKINYPRFYSTFFKKYSSKYKNYSKAAEMPIRPVSINLSSMSELSQSQVSMKSGGEPPGRLKGLITKHRIGQRVKTSLFNIQDPKKLQSLKNLNQKDIGPQLVKYLRLGIGPAINRRQEGRLVSNWDENRIYEQLSSTIFRYTFSLGYRRIFLVTAVFCFSIFLYIMVDVWTGFWSTNTKNEDFDIWTYTMIYIAISLSSAVFSLFRDNLFMRILHQNSRHVHDCVMDVFLRMNLPWYEEYPTCNIDFKLSYDLRTLDNNINDKLLRVFESATFLVGGLIILNYIYLGAMFVTTVLFIAVAAFVVRKFLRTVKNFIFFIKESSEVVLHFYNSAIFEMPQYRFLKKESILRDKFCRTSDEMQRSLSHFGFISKRWLGIRIGLINSTLIFTGYIFSIFYVFWYGEIFQLSELQVALSFTWSLKIVSYFNTLIHNLVLLHADIVGYGRLANFQKNVLVDNQPPKKIRKRTMVKVTQDLIFFKDLNLTLGKQLVLEDVTIRLERGKRVALIGESGTGKHALVDLILNIYECDQGQGTMRVFGQLQHLIDFKEARSHIVNLKEYPVLYSGTVKDNIDPDGTYSLEDLYKLMSLMESISSGKTFSQQSFESRSQLNLDLPNSFLSPSIHHRKRLSYIDNQMPGFAGSIGTSKLTVGTKALSKTSGSKDAGLGMGIDLMELDISESDKLRFKGMLDLKVGKQKRLPLETRRMIKILRLIIRKPRIAIIDQGALKLKGRSPEKVLRTLEVLLPDTSFLVVLYTYENILHYDFAYVLSAGKVIQAAQPIDAVLDDKSPLSLLIKKQDMKGLKFLQKSLELILSNKLQGEKDVEKGRFKKVDTAYLEKMQELKDILDYDEEIELDDIAFNGTVQRQYNYFEYNL